MPNGIFIPYSFDPAFASGFVDGAIETVDGIIKIVEVISCHDITSPTFYTDRCKDVRTQTWNTMRDIMNIIIYEDKRKAFFRDIGTMFSEYVDETLGLDNQARYNQGKLAFDAVSMFFGAGEIKAATKSGRLLSVLKNNIKKIDVKKLKKALKERRKIKLNIPKIDKKIVQELKDKGVKFTEKDLIWVFKNKEDQIIFLEKGKDSGGFQHILKHKKEFLNKGISEQDLANFIMESLKNGKIVGKEGSRFVYEYTYEGIKQTTAITVGSNGFVVGANPVSKFKKL